jgi:acyl-coenzyme A thioesterase PaaI-like protein
MSLRIDYLRPAAIDQEVRARAECYYISDSVAYVKAIANDNSSSDPIATAVGTFSVIEGRVTS